MSFDRARLQAELIRDESEVLHAYQDHLGYWTIGVGRLIDKRRGGGISQAESRVLLTNDIDVRERALDTRLPWWRTLPDGQQRALLNMSFQLGVAGLLDFPRMLAHLHDGRTADAAREALDSKWAREDTPERAARVVALLKAAEKLP